MTAIVVDEETKEWVVTDLDEDQAVDWYEPYWEDHDC